MTLLDTPFGWQDSAACADGDTRLWFGVFSGGVRDYSLAKQVCDGCPVQSECLIHALNQPEEHGMWGGLTPDERVKLRGVVPRERVRHGRVRTFRGGCHCAQCVTAYEAALRRDRERLAEWRRRGLAEDDRRHGTLTGYQTYRCRCGLCKAARKRYDSRKQAS